MEYPWTYWSWWWWKTDWQNYNDIQRAASKDWLLLGTWTETSWSVVVTSEIVNIATLTVWERRSDRVRRTGNSRNSGQNIIEKIFPYLTFDFVSFKEKFIIRRRRKRKRRGRLKADFHLKTIILHTHVLGVSENGATRLSNAHDMCYAVFRYSDTGNPILNSKMSGIVLIIPQQMALCWDFSTACACVFVYVYVQEWASVDLTTETASRSPLWNSLSTFTTPIHPIH